MSAFEDTISDLHRSPKRWLVTGVAGFIGSNLLEFLLRNDQQVTGLDNFATGHQRNLDEVESLVSTDSWKNFHFLEGDIGREEDCTMAVAGVDYILHQGALGSVPRSLNDPIASHASNATGTLNMLQAAKVEGVKRFVYASSSSVYGDHPDLPKVEANIGHCLSPYAATKRVVEIYADVFCRCYGMQAVGLRYFNVFGPRQDPDGPYAAVIPKWIDALLAAEPVLINGDGDTSRDFCHIENVIQANVLAACAPMDVARHAAYNVAVGARTSLNELFDLILANLQSQMAPLLKAAPEYRDFREGDVRHSLADISAAQNDLGYDPTHSIAEGMKQTISWYIADHQRRAALT